MIIPIFLVHQSDFFSALLHLLLIEKGLAADRDLFLQLVVAEVFVAIKYDFGDKRLFFDNECDGYPIWDSIRFYLNIFKKSHLVDDPDLASDRIKAIRISHFQRQTTPNGLIFNTLVPSNIDGRDRFRRLLSIEQRHGNTCEQEHDHRHVYDQPTAEWNGHRGLSTQTGGTLSWDVA